MTSRAAQDIAAHCIVMRVRRLNREISRLYDQAARPHGMTAARINVLVAIAVTPGVQASELVEPLSIEKSTLSRNIARLETDGLIRAVPLGRTRGLHLTAEGQRKVDALYPDWQRVQAEARRLLGTLTEPLMRFQGAAGGSAGN